MRRVPADVRRGRPGPRRRPDGGWRRGAAGGADRPGRRRATTRKAATRGRPRPLPVLLPHAAGPRPRQGDREGRAVPARTRGRRGCGWCPAAPASCPIPAADAEITGLYVDVGRLERTDARVTADFGTLSQRVLRRDWPAPGELLAVIVDTAVAAEPMNAPSVRHVALDPGRYVEQEVTVVGRFRGKNLYGDLPEAAGPAATTSSCSPPTRRSGSPAGGRRARAST